MKELKVQDITLTYGEKTLFDSISFSINEGERIGLIGVNGTGKTHLLNIISGKIKPEKGSVQHPRDYTIGYLKQHPELNEESNVLEAVFDGDNPIMKTVREYELALNLLEEDAQLHQEKYTKAEEQMNAKNAWTADAQAKSILTSLGITDLKAKIKTLSGGQAKRVGLAQVLIQEPDLLLLDEPTNHLDFETIQWLENYLKNYKGSLLMVTHDRYFLERVVGKIIELSSAQLHVYEGNYASYIKEKAEREEVDQKQEHKKVQLYKQELAWMRKGPKARGTKQEARKQRFESLAETMTERVTNEKIEVNLPTAHLGKKVIELENVSFNFNNHQILKEFNLLIQNRDRIGITGKNGAGKTTFLDLLTGKLEPHRGKVVIGETVKIGYYTQKAAEIDGDKRVIEFLQEIAEEVKTIDGNRVSVSQLLEKFLFPKHTHGTLISRLSGGEKKRLYLLSILMQQPNVLLLDEPTNDLDLATLRVLEDYIETFSGAVISVSHDRYYLDKTSDKLLIFKGDSQIDQFLGSLSEYQEQNQTETKRIEKKTKTEEKRPKKKQEKIKKTKLTFLETKEWETIEEELFEMEEEIEQIELQMTLNSTDFEKIQELESTRQEVKKQFDDKMQRWEYLSQFVD